MPDDEKAESPSDRSAEILQTIKTGLEKWSGSQWRLWSFEASHSTLVIRLLRTGTKNNLHIFCIGCRTIHCPAHLKNVALNIHMTPEVGAHTLILSDSTGAIKIESGTIWVQENVEPLFDIPL